MATRELEDYRETGPYMGWHLSIIRREWGLGELGPNYVNVIARSKGWHPLDVGEQMTVHYESDNKEYMIKRIK